MRYGDENRIVFRPRPRTGCEDQAPRCRCRICVILLTIIIVSSYASRMSS